MRIKREWEDMETYEKLKTLDVLLLKLDTTLILKLHPFQDQDKIGRLNMSHVMLLDHGRLVEWGLQINQLLEYSDGLISDYSSVAVDYMLLDKPIGFTLDDVEKYEESRGFVFENIQEWLPGKEIFSFEDMKRFIEDVASGKDPSSGKRRIIKEKMHKFQDGGSCRRVLHAFSL